ncbi:MAG: septum formation protein Maf [Ruminococcaceae bacterium]|nr:septum formation protein Maf [Oscillospiraceae bacterium]
MKYILASKSPRRREILENIGLEFEIITADTDESSEETDPARLCEILAIRKGEAVYNKLLSDGVDCSDVIIISSDTVVAAGGEILGKPHSREDARRMLRLLSGSQHSVLSGVSIIRNGSCYVDHSETLVTFDELSDEEIEEYISTDDPYDKAGGYGIQTHASLWVKEISGCYFGVVGLPVHKLNKLHKEATGRPLI